MLGHVKSEFTARNAHDPFSFDAARIQVRGDLIFVILCTKSEVSGAACVTFLTCRGELMRAWFDSESTANAFIEVTG